MPHIPTIVIGRSSSFCSACGQGANPSEKSHDTILEYSPNTGRPGCGVVYEAVGTDAYGDGIEQRVRGMRPDLPYRGHLFMYGFRNDNR